MKINEVLHSLEDWAPGMYQESYDNAQLICGNPEEEIRGILCTLDCTEAVVQEAIDRGCNLIVAHHPIVFSGLKSLTGKNYIERTVIAAIKSSVAIYAIHTNLDNVWTGVNRKIGDKIGLTDLRVLQPKQGLLRKLVVFVPNKQAPAVREAIFSAGGGEIGEYDHCSYNSTGTGTFRGGEQSDPHVGEKGKDHQEAETKIEIIYPRHRESAILKAMEDSHPYEEVAHDILSLSNTHPRLGSGMIGNLPEDMNETQFMKHLGKEFNLKVVRHTPLQSKMVKTVAFCGGSGSFLLLAAIKQNADVFITGDFKYHQFFDAEDHLVIMDIGHFESEQFTPHLIQEYLEEKFPTFAVLLSGVNTNPVEYFIT